MRKIPTYLQIIIGLILGLLWGFLSKSFDIPPSFTSDYIKPFGKIFINLLKMIAVPLVFASLIVGISQLNDIRKLSRMGGKTIGAYIVSTVFALTIGLLVVNIVQPGKDISQETRQALLQEYSEKVNTKLNTIDKVEESPLTPLVNTIPTNIVKSASENINMLQVVVFAMLVGIACISIPQEKSKPFTDFFDSFNEIIIKLIDFIMMLAPIGVFALTGALIVEISNPDVLFALIKYGFTVILGLGILGLFYGLVMFLFTRDIAFVWKFWKGIYPAQLLAFSTSSSSATLPLTIKQCEQEVGVSEKVSGFVLPLGATINMDGTSLYQGVAAVFIAQVIGKDLSLGEQLTIIMTAVLASIGSAGVPGAGMIMLAIVLESVGIPVQYIGLIMAPDRILDMCRTSINVTGDATVATIIAKSENQLKNIS
ncbi:MAG: dicarboxylate/amino acid:cation symporter [Cytophagales bacterium]|nr:dicarboxylate/amino acid:cation symporter [Cytophagales bacterium]